MYASNFLKIVPVAVLIALSSCASAPSRINDICAVFDQRDGWFDNWQSAANSTERKYGIPVHVLMATVRKESGFRGNAKPPRTKLLGFIPWTRVSSAYGYSQALDGTWSEYQRATGNYLGRRTKFADAVDFVGWYHSRSAETLGIDKSDAYRLYLAYYSGWTAYKNGSWQRNASLQRYARDTAQMAQTYAGQLQGCGG